MIVLAKCVHQDVCVHNENKKIAENTPHMLTHNCTCIKTSETNKAKTK